MSESKRATMLPRRVIITGLHPEITESEVRNILLTAIHPTLVIPIGIKCDRENKAVFAIEMFLRVTKQCISALGQRWYGIDWAPDNIPAAVLKTYAAKSLQGRRRTFIRFSPETKGKDLEEMVRQYGHIIAFRKKSGFAFVDFLLHQDAVECINQLSQIEGYSASWADHAVVDMCITRPNERKETGHQPSGNVSDSREQNKQRISSNSSSHLIPASASDATTRSEQRVQSLPSNSSSAEPIAPQ
ncbi:hypothetical protein K440DRAFT_674419 [Wilcoxina mikolae CBS 423.85]|nr:hypothetical protein K440DRAFT_674419 [Wilcoxina mikolae CBS 423.85]